MKDRLIDRTPEHFSRQDYIRAGIGALFLGFGAVFSGNLINIATNMPESHLYIIIFGTLLILTMEIYIVGYSRVTDKETRKFGQFWMKRIVAFYIIALIVAFVLAFTFGLQFLVPMRSDFFNIILIMSAPCAIGAAFGDLIKKY
jgi:uncharacterized membrane protein